MATAQELAHLDNARREYQQRCDELSHAVTFGTAWRVRQLREACESMAAYIENFEAELERQDGVQ